MVSKGTLIQKQFDVGVCTSVISQSKSSRDAGAPFQLKLQGCHSVEKLYIKFDSIEELGEWKEEVDLHVRNNLNRPGKV